MQAAAAAAVSQLLKYATASEKCRPLAFISIGVLLYSAPTQGGRGGGAFSRTRFYSTNYRIKTLSYRSNKVISLNIASLIFYDLA